MERGMPREGGAVLFVALIMLLLMTLLAVAAMRLTTTNLQAVGNEQFQTQAQAAADFALDQTVNNKDFIDIPVLTQKVSLTQADSTTDPSALSVTLSVPACERSRLIQKSELVTQVGGQDTVLEDDQPCFGGLSSAGVTIVDQSADAPTPTSDDSLCTTALFDVQADVNDPTTSASVTVNQGIELRMESAAADAKCTTP